MTRPIEIFESPVSRVRTGFSSCDVLWFSRDVGFDVGDFFSGAARGAAGSTVDWFSAGTWLSAGSQNMVVACSWQKDTDSPAGVCTVHLKPGRDWQRLIKPGDALLVFMGRQRGSTTCVSLVLVDRVEESRVAHEQLGATIETISVTARDVGKILVETSTVIDPAFVTYERNFFTTEWYKLVQDTQARSPVELVLYLLDVFYNAGSTGAELVRAQWRFPGVEDLPTMALVDMASCVQAPMFGYMNPETMPVAESGNVWTLVQQYANRCVNELFLDVRDVDQGSKAFYDHVEAVASAHMPQGDADEQRFVRDDVAGRFSALGGGSVVTTEALRSAGSHLDLAAAGSRVCLVFRQYPYDTGAFLSLPTSVVDETEVISSSLGRAYHGVVNLFRFNKDMFGFSGAAQEVHFGLMVNKASISKFGLRRMEVETKFPFASRGAMSSWDEGELLEEAVFGPTFDYYVNLVSTWHAYNEALLEGSITTHFRPDIRCGTRFVLTRSDARGKRQVLHFYVQGVSHQFHYDPAQSTSTFTLVRGVDFAERGPETGLYWTGKGRALTVEDPYNLFRHAGGMEPPPNNEEVVEDLVFEEDPG